MTTLDFITELFCKVDDTLRDVPKHPQANLYPSVTFAQPAPESLDQMRFCTAWSEASNLAGGGNARDDCYLGLAVGQHPTWDAGRLR